MCIVQQEKNVVHTIVYQFLRIVLSSCVFLQNYIKRPTDFSSQCTPEFVESLYEENGFCDVVRHNYFVKRTDIRKFSAPLHYHRNNPISKVLYGHGGVQYLGIKK